MMIPCGAAQCVDSDIQSQIFFVTVVNRRKMYRATAKILNPPYGGLTGITQLRCY